MVNRDLVLEKFNSVSEMTKALNRPTNKVFTGRKLASFENDAEAKEFTGTASFEDALNQLKTGRPEIMSELKKDVEKIDVLGTGIKTHHQNDFAGYAPNVARALAGLPRDMRRKIKTRNDVKIITLVYNFGASGMTSQRALDNAGKAFFRLAYRLEQSGIKTNIFVLPKCSDAELDVSNTQTFCVLTKIKDYTGRFDITRFSFALTSPSMFRRFGFRLLETSPKVTDTEFRYGYGYSLSGDDLENVLQQIPELKKQKYVAFSSVDFIAADFDETKFIDKIKEKF